MWPSITQPSPSCDRARREQRRVRAGGVGLGHRERRAQVAREQRLEPAALLVRRPGEREDLGVARVGRVVAEHERRVGRAAEDLVHQAELDLAEALPAQLGRQVRSPQPALLDLVAQWRDRALEAVLAELLEDGLDRPDLGADEVGHPVQLALELRLGREVPGHPFRRVTRDEPARGGCRLRGGRRRRAPVVDRLRLRARRGAAAVRCRLAGRGGRAADRARARDRPAYAADRAAPSRARLARRPVRDRLVAARRARRRRGAALARRDRAAAARDRRRRVRARREPARRRGARRRRPALRTSRRAGHGPRPGCSPAR